MKKTLFILLAVISFGLLLNAQDVDIYVAGYEKNALNEWIPKIWKNGGLLYSFPANGGSSPRVFVSGNDVYAVVVEKNASGKNVAKVWINGTESYTLNCKSSA